MPEGSIWKGIGIGVLLTLGGIVVSIPLFMIAVGYVTLFGIGLAQAIWMIPAWRKYQKRGESETAKGLLICAGLVFLLNASCWGLLAGAKFQ